MQDKGDGWRDSTDGRAGCLCGAEGLSLKKTTVLAPQWHHLAGEERTEEPRSTRCTQPRNKESKWTRMGAGCAVLSKRFARLFKCFSCA